MEEMLVTVLGSCGKSGLLDISALKIASAFQLGRA
jgi:hypothetical protein